MNVLVVGNGAREHAIAWKLSHSSRVRKLYVAPGNAGTAQIATNVPVTATDIDGLLEFARASDVDLTVVGPEAPLAAGIADRFQDAGRLIFGPTKAAARIESSKSFAKELMALHGVPTASAESFTSYAEASDYLRNAPIPVVVKADGLAAGKGVVVAQTRQEAYEALQRQMQERLFGPAGDLVLIEEYLVGQEVSVFAFVDGEHISPMVAACDYKRVGDGDLGPNTGGMGSYSPAPVWDVDLEARVRSGIMEPVARALSARGTPYRGILYAGLILTEQGPKVLEFNCRLGDPETQVILPLLKADMAETMMSTALGELEGISIEWDARACVGVVMASGGYPDQYSTGYVVEGMNEVEGDVNVFHSGTKLVYDDVSGEPRVITDGGRVVTVTAIAVTIDEARSRAYEAAGHIHFKDSYYRRDIASRVTNVPAEVINT